MRASSIIKYFGYMSMLWLSGCFSPPFNHFLPDPRPIGPSAVTTMTTRVALIKKLSREGIQFVKYGDQNTLIVPTDRYYVFPTHHLNDICYPGLNDLVELIKTFNYGKVYVAAFTDDVGSREHKDNLSNAQAETMVGFLWAKGIPAKKLMPEGYGDAHTIGDNHYIHASAYNRRIEIQWSEWMPHQQSVAAMMTK